MEEKLEKLPIMFFKDVYMMKNGLNEFWIYTDDYQQKELHICIYNKQEPLKYYTNYFKFKDPIKDLIIINDKTILFLFIKENKITLKILESKKILNNDKKEYDINDKDFISIFSFDLSNYDSDNCNHNKILFNEEGNKLILLAYGIINILDYNKETYKFQLMSNFSYKIPIRTLLLFSKNIIYAFTDYNFFIFDAIKNQKLKEISYCDNKEEAYFHNIMCFSKNKKYLAYSCKVNSIYIIDTEKLTKRECYNLKTEIKTNIKEDENDQNESKPTEYNISGIIPFKDYFLFSKVKEVTVRPATNRPRMVSLETSFVNLRIKDNKNSWRFSECEEIHRDKKDRLKVFSIGGKAYYGDTKY